MSGLQDQQETDFMASLFPTEPTLLPKSNGSQLSAFAFNGHENPQNPTTNPYAQQLLSSTMGSLNDFISTMSADIQQQPSLGLGNQQFNPQAMEQQIKLQRLQQLQALQNQIFQEQIALISVQRSSAHSDGREQLHEQNVPFQGLPTPASSVEMRPQVMPVVPSMTPQYLPPPLHTDQLPFMSPHPESPMDVPQQSYYSTRGSASAPAHIAFQQTNLPMDLDISPLIRPWIDSDQPQPGSRKRTASPDPENFARKRQSPAFGPAFTTMSISRQSSRKAVSTTNTPMMRASSSRARRRSVAGEHDSPSPVDLSMPPPAQPVNMAVPPSSGSGNSSGDNTALGSNTSPMLNPQFVPVTPASIMNLHRLGSNKGGLAPTIPTPPPRIELEAPQASRPVEKRQIRARGDTLSTQTTKTSKKASSSAKPTRSGPSASTASSSSAAVGPNGPDRKSSHKDAEQRRRDSLKIAYNELRLLIPPIPSAVDDQAEAVAGRVLPGALRPRGPPKVGSEGPNQNVSKLQLLLCGNEFMRRLKGRVERRDEEVDLLRNEISRLRELLGKNLILDDENEADKIDLEKDLDAAEALNAGVWQAVIANGEDGEDGED